MTTNATLFTDEMIDFFYNHNFSLLFSIDGPEKIHDINRRRSDGTGSFKIALKSKAPIVPIALIDSYKVFNSFHIGPITTYVYYLEPITYEEYKDLKTQEIAALVKERIEQKIKEVRG